MSQSQASQNTVTSAPAGGAAGSATSSGGQAPSAGTAGSGGLSSAGAGAVGGAAPSAASDWTSGLSEDLRGFVGNKGFKQPSDAIEAYRGLEKLLGAPKDRLTVMPERFYDDQGKLTAEGRALRERIGAPKDAKEYNLPVPQGGDANLMEHFKGMFHEMGVPKDDAQKIAEGWNKYQQAQVESMKEQAAQTFRDQQAQLSKEWGAALEQNTRIASDAVRAMGIDQQKIDAFSAIVGHSEAMKFFHKLGRQVGEAPFIGGQRPDRVLEPESARSQIKELITDKEFGKKMASGDRDAMAKWTRLHEQGFPGERTI